MKTMNKINTYGNWIFVEKKLWKIKIYVSHLVLFICLLGHMAKFKIKDIILLVLL